MRAKKYGLVKRLMGAALLAFLSGCARHGQVESGQLPVRRVVVYRNGVAYFERSGEVNSKRVEFKLRRENIGDFLATLAVMERGGHTVRAASFPVSMEEERRAPTDPNLEQTLAAWERKEVDTRELRRVSLELDGERHKLTIGYLAETPLWRPSYRLVVGEKGQAVLQAWGIVQNQSGEDWRNVQIALVAGAPIAFESTLGDPVVPPRPVVTDQGEVISSVPEGTSSYHEEPPPVEAAEESVSLDEAEQDDANESELKYRRAESTQAGAGIGSMAADRSQGPIAVPTPAPSSEPRDPSRLAQVQRQTGATRYEVPYRVTVPDKSATMVLLVSKNVSGEAVFLFSPDPGVLDSAVHPFRVARFKNSSGGLLERGPIAVFESGAFLGQGVLESLPENGRATVPFALMRSLSIQQEVSHDLRGARLYAVREGEMTIERDQATITAYRLKNGEDEPAKVLIRHPRMYGAKLWEPVEGTEELPDERAALVPVNVPAYGKASLTVEERLPVRRTADFRSLEARSAIREFLKGKGVTEAQRKALEDILKHAAQLATLDDQERRLVREQRELERSTNETRSSLKAIKENTQAGSLRAELTTRLAEGTKRLDEITKDLVGLQLRRTEQEVRLKQARQGLVVDPPDRRSTDGASGVSNTSLN